MAEFTYRRDHPMQPYHIFEGEGGTDMLGQYPLRPLCGTLSPGSWTSDVTSERPTEAPICDGCDWELRARSEDV
jgi:hypothetical protein